MSSLQGASNWQDISVMLWKIMCIAHQRASIGLWHSTWGVLILPLILLYYKLGLAANTLNTITLICNIKQLLFRTITLYLRIFIFDRTLTCWDVSHPVSGHHSMFLGLLAWSHPGHCDSYRPVLKVTSVCQWVSIMNTATHPLVLSASQGRNRVNLSCHELSC